MAEQMNEPALQQLDDEQLQHAGGGSQFETVNKKRRMKFVMI